jgi:hypothetical protein
MVAPNYTAQRSALAKKLGFGRPAKKDATTKKGKRDFMVSRWATDPGQRMYD